MTLLSIARVKEWYAKNQEKIREDFFAFLRIPSISADSKYHNDVCFAAEWLVEYLNKIGMKASLWGTSGKPVVFATFMTGDPSQPTLLIYHHYDVQPVDPLELWKAPPFEPQLINNQVYARGASDNKGQCFFTVTALKAFLELAKEAKVNIKLFIEGEEESGGQGTYEVLEQRKDEIKADHLLIVDAGLKSPEAPAVTVGTRGIMAMEIECRNSKIDLHSGVHGGIALNPNRALASALAQLWDDKGKVQVPGFYDGIIVPSKEELDQYDMNFDLEEYQREFGVHAFAADAGFSLIESNLVRPTLEINGMSGGYAGEGFKTVLPAKANAKISCRLVPGQDPEKIYQNIASFLRTRLPEGLTIKVSYHHGGKAFRTSLSSPVVKIAANAYEEVWGKPCQFLLNGATIPIIGALAEASKASVALVGVALDTDDFHAPNEHFSMDRFEKGVLLMASILSRHGS